MIRAVSLFSGIGALDLGARSVGVAVELATDIDSKALTILESRDRVSTVRGDLRHLVRSGELRASWVGTAPDLLLGGPPCTAFSHAGFWLDAKRNGDDPQAGLLAAYVDALVQFKPRAFIMENVPGLAFKTHNRFLGSFVNRVRRAGYATSWSILNAADLGTAQQRRRLFVVGVLGGPRADLDNFAVYPERTARWAFKKLTRNPSEPDEQPGLKYGSLLAEVPPGGNYLVFTRERGHPEGLFKYRGRYWSFLLKLHPDRPSPTIPAQRVTYNGPFHWSSRHLRVRELARLQGLPDHQPLGDDPALNRRWIGNGVPPLLGAVVTDRVLRVLEPQQPLPSVLARSLDPTSTFVDISRALLSNSTTGVAG
jgi:DNA (cytosine-5)-methyltransferase 1